MVKINNAFHQNALQVLITHILQCMQFLKKYSFKYTILATNGVFNRKKRYTALITPMKES